MNKKWKLLEIITGKLQELLGPDDINIEYNHKLRSNGQTIGEIDVLITYRIGTTLICV